MSQLDKTSDVRDLAAIHDRGFVIAAYRAVLGREPDAAGIEVYLGHLRSGMDKMQVLACLHDSDEGRRAGTNVRGLRSVLIMHSLGNLPVIGGALRRLLALWNRPDFERERRCVEGTIFAELDKQKMESTRAFEDIARTFGEMQRVHEQLESAISERATTEALAAVNQALGVLEGTSRKLEEMIARKADDKVLDDLRASKADRVELAELEPQIRAIQSRFEELQKRQVDWGVIEQLRASKLDRSEFSDLHPRIGTLQSSLDELRNLTVEKPALEQMLAAKADKAELDQTREAKADRSALVEMDTALQNLRITSDLLSAAKEQMILALDAKSDRSEYAGLTSTLLKLTQTIVGTGNIDLFEKSIRRSLDQLPQNDSGISADPS